MWADDGYAIGALPGYDPEPRYFQREDQVDAQFINEGQALSAIYGDPDEDRDFTAADLDHSNDEAAPGWNPGTAA